MRRLLSVLLGVALLVPLQGLGAQAENRRERYSTAWINVFWHSRQKVDGDTYRLITWYAGAYDSGEEYGFWSDLYRSVSECEKRDGRDKCRYLRKLSYYGDTREGTFTIDRKLSTSHLAATYKLHRWVHGERGSWPTAAARTPITRAASSTATAATGSRGRGPRPGRSRERVRTPATLVRPTTRGWVEATTWTSATTAESKEGRAIEGTEREGAMRVKRRTWRWALLMTSTALLGSLTPTPPASATFPSQPDRILFMRDPGTGYTAIFTSEPDGTNEDQLSPGTATDADGRWSPDGSLILFWSTRDGDAEVFRMRADSTKVRKLTKNTDLDMEPSWSPDAKRIAFLSDRDGSMDLYTMARDGTDVQQVTDDDTSEFLTSWSPKGRRILFNASAGSDYEIYSIRPDGSGLRNLTDNTYTDGIGDWSADGSRIVFHSDR